MHDDTHFSMTLPRLRGARALVLVSTLLLALLVLPAAVAQIEEQDLPPESYTEIAYDRLTAEELAQRYRAAQEAFRNDPAGPAVLELANALVRILETRVGEAEGALAELPDGVPATPSDTLVRDRARLESSLLLRARALDARGDSAGADQDLVRILAQNPAFEMPSQGIDANFANRYIALRRSSLGRLNLTVTPQDARVLVDSRRVDPSSGELPVAAGTRTITAKRPGYADIVMQVEVPGGRTVPLNLELERNSAMLRLVTRPSDVEVRVDGQPVGVTQGTLPPGYPVPPAASRYPRSELSAPLRIGDLTPGDHRLELSREGYRPYRVSVSVPELRDYDAGVMILERERGTLVLRSLPPGATVELDGEVVRPLPLGGGGGRLDLAPGEHRLVVSDAAAGVFETRVTVGDGEEKEVALDLRPALVLVGVVGGDGVAGGKLRTALAEAGSQLERWLFLDRSEESSDLLARPELNASVLRAATGPAAAAGRSTVRWDQVRQAMERRYPGSVYALAVLSDDLLASHADLWFLPASPAPALPDHRRIPTHRPEAVAQVIEGFDQPVELQRPWLGALLVDSAAAQGPVVASVTSGGPAASSGLAPGDEILALSGETPGTAAALMERLAEQPEGSSLSVTVLRGTETRTVDLRLGITPAVVPLDSPDLIYASISAFLTALASDPLDGTAPWLIELNQAAVYLHGRDYEEAVKVLRGIEAPTGSGLGQGTVDYWLAVALRALGPDYAAQAQGALQRAAAQEGARLFHNDGPRVAPRARAQLSGGG
ncbi:MAG: PEGA domain-containing protein [Acidobacteriota bacterium]|nr:PEGA domain-containing protein [Acidobacteriota bacterium]